MDSEEYGDSWRKITSKRVDDQEVVRKQDWRSFKTFIRTEVEKKEGRKSEEEMVI